MIGVVRPPVDSETASARCGSIARLLGAHADGQLDAAKTVEVDDHLGRCESCRERVALDRAIRGSLKKAVKTSAPDDVRARMLAAIAGQAARDVTRSLPVPGESPSDALNTDVPRPSAAATSSSRRPAMLRHWRTMMPLASAAAIAVAWGFAGQQPMALADGTSRLGAGFSNDELVNQFVDIHSHPLRPETSDPNQVRAFEREVGVPVRIPQPQKNVRFLGARLLPVQGGEHAAMLEHEVAQEGGNVERVTVFIFNPQRIRVRSADQLPPRAVGTAQVRVGQARGYSFAVSEHDGVGYAVVSDLEDSSAQFVAAADLE